MRGSDDRARDLLRRLYVRICLDLAQGDEEDWKLLVAVRRFLYPEGFQYEADGDVDRQ